MEGEVGGGVIAQDHEKKDERFQLEDFRLYRTRSKFYVIGREKNWSCYRVLKIDRFNPCELNIWEDGTIYSESECKDLLRMIHGGNMSSGGLKFLTIFCGIIGFVKFLGPYYMILITERKEIGSICGHAVYAVAKTNMIAFSSTDGAVPSDLVDSESRYKKILRSMDLAKDFFFSYSHLIMNSLQKNFCDTQANAASAYDSMFVWNAFLTRGIRSILQNTVWTVALVHGFFKQEKLAISGKEFKLTLIARRSRFFAGTRYRKRGVNEKGRVANDVETEQIIADDVSGACPVRLTSAVQIRGSIPLFWSQDTSLLNLRPNITLHRKDQNYEATKLHFKNLVGRYGNPIIIFSLIKKREKKPRESILHNEFVKAINFLNKDLSLGNRLKFAHWDLHKFSRRKARSALLFLTEVANYALTLTSFFHCEMTSSLGLGDSLTLPIPKSQKGSGADNIKDGFCEDNALSSYHLVKACRFQGGVLRTNCIDCLDRTNVAQFAYGLAALGRQLHALDFIDAPKIDLDAPLTKDLMKFYEAMGNTLAKQYGGSGAHNKIFSEKRGQWKAATRSQEFLIYLQRYYSNTYMDALKQDAINLFLGYFQPQLGKPALWELDSDQHFKIGRASCSSDEISRPCLKRSLSTGNMSHESNSIPSTSPNLETKDVKSSELPKAMLQDGEIKSNLNEIPKSSLFDIETPNPRHLFTDSDQIFFNELGACGSNPPKFLDLDWIASLGFDVETSKRSFVSNSCNERPTRNMVHGRIRGMMPASGQNDPSGIDGEKTEEPQDSAPSRDFLQWINYGGGLFQ